MVSTCLERIEQRLQDQGLEVQYVARTLITKLRRDHRAALIKRLRSKLSSFPPANFEVLQLNPRHWTLYQEAQDCQGRLGKTTLADAILLDDGRHTDQSMIGGAYHFLSCGPFSLRALFSPRSYYAVERPIRDEGSLTPTLASRLHCFHVTLKAVKERFDAQPDTGLIGKSIQSFFLRIYLTQRATAGSFWIVTFMTIGTIISSLLNLVVLTLAPVTASSLKVITALFNLIVYDTAIAAARDRAIEEASGRRTGSDPEMPSCVSPLLKIGLGVPYFLVFPGTLQAILATVRLVVVHPVAGTICISWASLRFVVRSRFAHVVLYPEVVSHSPLQHLLGMAHPRSWSGSNRVLPAAAKASVLLLLDNYRLHAHAQIRIRELDAPYHCYSELFNRLVQPFGVSILMKVSSPSSIGSRISSEVCSERLRIHGENRQSRAFAQDFNEGEPGEKDDEISDDYEYVAPFDDESFDNHGQTTILPQLLRSISLTSGPR